MGLITLHTPMHMTDSDTTTEFEANDIIQVKSVVGDDNRDGSHFWIRGIPERQHCLESAKTLKKLIQENKGKGGQMPDNTSTRKIFVVHGHDDEMKMAVARVLTQLNFEPVILHEQANEGQTIIEKFEKHADVGFAVVLLSPDDMAFKKGSTADLAKPRARQNVILELGYFAGKRGRGKVLPLYREGSDLELPSDFAGVVYTPYDKADGAWRYELAKELKAAGYEVDKNLLP